MTGDHPAGSEALKEAVVQASRLLFSAGVMQPSGHGNLSARLGDERMVLTGTSTIRDLAVDQLATVSFEGAVLQGALDPASAEIVAMHAAIYRARPHVGAVIHTHSPHATAFAVAHEPLPCVYEPLLRFGLAEPIPVAAWAPRGSPASVSNIVDLVEAHPAIPVVLLANHGLLAFGDDPLMTARLVIVVEEAAAVTLRARQLGGALGFPPDALARERQRMAQFGSRA